MSHAWDEMRSIIWCKISAVNQPASRWLGSTVIHVLYSLTKGSHCRVGVFGAQAASMWTYVDTVRKLAIELHISRTAPIISSLNNDADDKRLTDPRDAGIRYFFSLEKRTNTGSVQKMIFSIYILFS
ncbi:hypothetical protein M758_7G155100 [Ceratodon purpureus]|nr:hypothetical protein M758_7G155100 [Ceratodon purpureus]